VDNALKEVMWIVSEVLIAPLIAFQIYKGDQLCYDFFSDYGRNKRRFIGKFQPRSFNMGLSRKAFDASKGFEIYILEDPDLSIRLWNLGFETKLFTNAYVYHKRRIDWDKFSVQVNKFGKARPILNSWYPKYSKLTFFFLQLFIIGFAIAALMLILMLTYYLNCISFIF
jgi:GT2 family glycosyltransferase